MTEKRIRTGLMWALMLVGSCGSDEGSRIQLAVAYESSWGLESFEIELDGKVRSVSARSSVELLVPDELAGEEQAIKVGGMRDSGEGLKRFAFGKTMATPELGVTVNASVTLFRLPCGAWCTEGSSSCSGDSVVTCTNRDSDSCLEWADPVPCGGDTPFCSLGACRSECIDECAQGEVRCAGPGGVQQCGDFDSDDCMEWSDVALCAEGESCSAGACTETCRDECTDGESTCSGGGVIFCADRNFDGCSEWGPVEPCGEGQSCSQGACIEGCVDECTESVCFGTMLRECGQFDADACLDQSPGVSCLPADPCMDGMCDPSGGCSTAPKVCEEPPASECIDENTLRTYEPVGQCTSGTCEYTFADTTCEGTCANGTCDDTTTCTPTSWMTSLITTINDTGKRLTSIAVDAQNSLHVSYYDASEGEIRYARRKPGGAWSVFTVSSTTDEAASSIAVSSAGTLHIAYRVVGVRGLIHAESTDGLTWNKTQVALTEMFPSLTIDSAGGAHIVYATDVDYIMHHAHKPHGGTWSTERIDPGTERAGVYNSIVVDSNGDLHVTYASNWSIRHAIKPSGQAQWTIETVDDSLVVFQPSLGIAPNGTVHIAYRKEVHFGSEVHHAWKPKGSAWLTEVVTTGDTNTTELAFSVDAKDNIHLVFYAGDFRHATRASSGGSWTMTTIGQDLARHPSLAIANDGSLHVAYRNEDMQSLAYAHRGCQ